MATDSELGNICLLVGWLVLGATATQPVALLVLVFVQGALSFAVGSTLIGRIMATTQDAPTMGGSFVTVALNLGAILGPILGGIAFGSLTAQGPVFVSAGLIIVVLLVWMMHAIRLRREHIR